MFSSRRIMTFLITLVSVCLISTMAYAEDVEIDRPTGLEAGAHVLSFGLPAGGSNWGGNIGIPMISIPTANYFHNFDPQFQFGGGVGFGYADDLAFDLSPTAKFFLSTTERTVPYVYGNVDLTYDGDDFDLGIGAGLGAEFFPVPEFSIGGRAGITLVEAAEPADIITFVSGLDANFYF